MSVATIEEAIEDIRLGKMVILVDDEDRENEGDLTLAAEAATPENINFMAKYGRGLICLTLTSEKCEELGLRPMVRDNTSPFETAFTVSIEAKHGVTTGISAADRALTIVTAVAEGASARDLGQSRPCFSAQSPQGWRSCASRADRGFSRPCSPGGVETGRSHLRNNERRRHDGPYAGTENIRERAQHKNLHDCGSGGISTQERATGAHCSRSASPLLFRRRMAGNRF